MQTLQNPLFVQLLADNESGTDQFVAVILPRDSAEDERRLYPKDESADVACFNGPWAESIIPSLEHEKTRIDGSEHQI
ncbi:hypothetical protein J7T55_000084 [Diaporthe amygdali]|uniref:uncharacterized protein n=1 Tax=Phomopsis amygdali TaxID=1214568 RepID=UPI0022FDEE9F|nr:uncharacterized protein J7T55_000084 [Diaporthe amygdali]KAJ0107821.1 hypothetical protein J7T55_000084 [Diaporthe amygdali]